MTRLTSEMRALPGVRVVASGMVFLTHVTVRELGGRDGSRIDTFLFSKPI